MSQREYDEAADPAVVDRLHGATVPMMSVDPAAVVAGGRRRARRRRMAVGGGVLGSFALAAVVWAGAEGHLPGLADASPQPAGQAIWDTSTDFERTYDLCGDKGCETGMRGFRVVRRANASGYSVTEPSGAPCTLSTAGLADGLVDAQCSSVSLLLVPIPLGTLNVDTGIDSPLVADDPGGPHLGQGGRPDDRLFVQPHVAPLGSVEDVVLLDDKNVPSSFAGLDIPTAELDLGGGDRAQVWYSPEVGAAGHAARGRSSYSSGDGGLFGPPKIPVRAGDRVAAVTFVPSSATDIRLVDGEGTVQRQRMGRGVDAAYVTVADEAQALSTEFAWTVDGKDVGTRAVDPDWGDLGSVDETVTPGGGGGPGDAWRLSLKDGRVTVADADGAACDPGAPQDNPMAAEMVVRQCGSASVYVARVPGGAEAGEVMAVGARGEKAPTALSAPVTTSTGERLVLVASEDALSDLVWMDDAGSAVAASGVELATTTVSQGGSSARVWVHRNGPRTTWAASVRSADNLGRQPTGFRPVTGSAGAHIGLDQTTVSVNVVPRGAALRHPPADTPVERAAVPGTDLEVVLTTTGSIGGKDVDLSPVRAE